MHLTGGKVDNEAPRKQAEKLAATSPAFARLQAAEKNMLETFPTFAVAVLAALQAGVAKDTVSLYATAWLISRGLFIVIYAIQRNAAMAFMRSMSFTLAHVLACK